MSNNRILIECECCGFVGVIYGRDDYTKLNCPLCISTGCESKFTFQKLRTDKAIDILVQLMKQDNQVAA